MKEGNVKGREGKEEKKKSRNNKTYKVQIKTAIFIFIKSLLYTTHCARHLTCTILHNITLVTTVICKHSSRKVSS